MSPETEQTTIIDEHADAPEEDVINALITKYETRIGELERERDIALADVANHKKAISRILNGQTQTAHAAGIPDRFKKL